MKLMDSNLSDAHGGEVGLVAQVAGVVTPWFKAAGIVVVLLGRTREELAAVSTYKLFMDW